MSKIYVSDLDGTLLASDCTLSAFSRAVLQELLMDGLPFTVASARSIVSIQMILAGLKLRLPIIEFNGAFISDWETGRHQMVNSLERAIAEDIYGVVQQFGCHPFISTYDGDQDRLYYNEIINDGMQWYLDNRREVKDKRLRRADHLTDCFGDSVVCITVIGHGEMLMDLERAIEERHGAAVEIHNFENQYSPGWHWLTVHDCRATKDQAIRIVRDEYGLNDHELVVFGDQVNDIKMFQAADRGIAVSNAVDELKRSATQVIGSNDEDSVVKFIRANEDRERKE